MGANFYVVLAVFFDMFLLFVFMLFIFEKVLYVCTIRYYVYFSIDT